MNVSDAEFAIGIVAPKSVGAEFVKLVAAMKSQSIRITECRRNRVRP